MFGLKTLAKTLSTPPPYTSPVLTLLTTDILLFLKLSITWPLTSGLLSIILPFRPSPSGSLDELAFNPENIKCDIVHTILFITQILFLGSLVVLLFTGLPAILYFLWMIVFVLGNMGFCRIFLNGPADQKFSAGEEYAENPEHEGEKWVFVNGVAVGSHWMKSNLKRLAKTFRRPIVGIHNPSYGIPFDVLECILQRTFSYPTNDIRNIYKHLSHTLSSPSTKKLILIAHSQGAIEVSLVLDWLYATLPRNDIAKLEIFTFGNAANHFNIPFDEKGLVIRHVEHYANEGDWVARFGVLHFRQAASHTSTEVGVGENANINAGGSAGPADNALAQAQSPTPQTPVPGEGRRQSTFDIETQRAKKHRFVGRLFKRTGFSGHQMNQHYLDNMFVMDANLRQVIDDDGDVGNGGERPGVNGNRNANQKKEAKGKGKVLRERFMEMQLDQKTLDDDDTVIPLLSSADGAEGRGI